MDLYRSVASLGKRATAKGSMALYGDAVSGVSAYTAARAEGTSSLNTAPEPRREQEEGARQLAHKQAGGDDAVEDNPWLFTRTRSGGSTASGRSRGGKAKGSSFKRAESSGAASERGSMLQHDRELALLDAHFTGELRSAADAACQSSLAPLDGLDGQASCPAGPEGNDYTAVGRVSTAGGGVGEIQAREGGGSVADARQMAPAQAAVSHVTARQSLRGHAIVDGREVEMTDFADAGRLLVAKSPTAVRFEEFVDEEDEEEPATETSTRSLVILVCGVCQAQLGMIMFNLGLNFGFTSLGDQVGRPRPPALPFLPPSLPPSLPSLPFPPSPSLYLAPSGAFSRGWCGIDCGVSAA